MWGRGNTETDTELTADNPRYQEQRWGLSTSPGTVGLQAGTHSAHTLITFNVCLGSRQGPQGKGWRRPVPTKTRVPIGTPPGPLGQWALGICDTDMVCMYTLGTLTISYSKQTAHCPVFPGSGSCPPHEWCLSSPSPPTTGVSPELVQGKTDSGCRLDDRQAVPRSVKCI